MYYLYILSSQKDGKHYIGVTRDLVLRLKQHNWGKVKSTKSRKPFRLIYSEKFDLKTEALKREKYLKSYKGWKERLDLRLN